MQMDTFGKIQLFSAKNTQRVTHKITFPQLKIFKEQKIEEKIRNFSQNWKVSKGETH